METNPYPKAIFDELTKIGIANNEHYIWEDGKKAGVKEIIKALAMIDKEAYDVKDFTRRVCDLIVEWQAKLKEWE